MSQLPNFELPDNQLVAQDELVEQFGTRFPGMEGLVKAAIDVVERQVGMASNDIRIVPEQREEPETARIANEAGYLKPAIQAVALLTIAMPTEPVTEPGMTLQEENVAIARSKGTVAIGGLEPESKALLTGLYSLTGAKIIRDDQHPLLGEGAESGVVVRRGEYLGRAVHFVENYAEFDSTYAKGPTLSVQMVTDPDSIR